MPKKANYPDTLVSFFLQEKSSLSQKSVTLISPSDRHNKLFYIEYGFVEAYAVTEDGEKKEIIIYKKGEIFPISALGNTKRSSVYYQTLGETKLRIVSRVELMAFLNEKPKIATSLMEKIVFIFDRYVDRVENLGLSKASSRIRRRLVPLADRLGESHSRSVVIAAPITHEIIASSVNTSRETVSRELGKLEKEGIIHYEGHRIMIEDLEKLKASFSSL